VSEWGRKSTRAGRSRQPVWTWAAVFVWLSIFAGGMVYRYTQQWSFAEREYLETTCGLQRSVAVGRELLPASDLCR